MKQQDAESDRPQLTENATMRAMGGIHVSPFTIGLAKEIKRAYFARGPEPRCE